MVPSRLGSKILLALAATTISVSSAALLGELLVRHRERTRATVPGTITMLYYRHDRLGHALVRDTDYFGWMRINKDGFRGSEVSVEKPPRTIRIMAIGASTTFDTQVTSDDRTWPVQLERWLNETNPEHPIEVINAGVPGYRVLDNLIRLQTDLFRFMPDVIILYQAHNDISCALRERHEPRPVAPKRPNAIPAIAPWRQWLENRSLLYNKLASRWLVIRGARATATRPPVDSSAVTPPRCGHEQFARDLASFVVVAQQLGIRVVIPQVQHISGVDATGEPDSTLQRRWRSVRPYDHELRGLRMYVDYAEIARSVADRFGVPFIETRDFELQGEEWYADPFHFNDRGAERMAHHLGRALLDIGILQGRGAGGS